MPAHGDQGGMPRDTAMTTRDARLVAEAWVRAEVERRPEVVGALLAGSTRARATDEPQPRGSDVDIFLFIDGDVPSDIREPGGRFAPRKLTHRGLVLEPSFHDARRLADPEAVAGDMHLAPVLADPCILVDPLGRLRALASALAPIVFRRRYARQRLEQALAGAVPSEPYGSVPDGPGLGAACWRHAAHAFGTMRCAGAVLVAAQAYPTTRRSFITARAILRDLGREEVADGLLHLLGSDRLSRAEVEALAAEAELTYDIAVAVRRTPVALGWNVSRDARELERAAVREMIDAGHHREALFQLLLVRTAAQGILENDGDGPARASSSRGYQRLLAALGLDGDDSFRARGEAVRAFLPVLRDACEALLARAPGLVD